MTKTDFNTKYGRVAMPTPFAGGSSATKATIYDAGTGGDFNFADGFASPYSAPKSNNGKFVTRGEINCLGNVATANDFNRMCGGINTFDATFAAKIAGYPKDAVLKYLFNGYLYDVISLVDNNLVNFVENGIDEVNWNYLSVPEKMVDDAIFFEGASGISPGSALLGVIKAEKSGALIIKSSLSPVIGSDTEVDSYSSATVRQDYGCSIIIRDCGTSMPSSIDFPNRGTITAPGTGTPNWNNWLQLSGDYQWFCATSSSWAMYPMAILAGMFNTVTVDHYYAIAIISGNSAFTQSYTDVTNNRVTGKIYTSTSGTLKLIYS